jgi:prophage maintenance system killer protein
MEHNTFSHPLLFLIHQNPHPFLIPMIQYLSEEQITEINKASLGITSEKNKFSIIQPDDLRFAMRFTEKNFGKNIIRKALAYCIAIITFHAFKNGNHRTSLLAAEEFLLTNGYQSLTTDQRDLELQKWRIIYEQDHDLEREFFRITNIEDETQRTKELKIIMQSEYGHTIEKWLYENFKGKESSELSSSI